MRSKWLLAFTLIAFVGVVFFSCKQAQACWISLSAGEMYDQADTIIVGKIIGVDKEIQAGSEFLIWMTSWRVEADFLLKGEAASEEDKDQGLYFVATPGVPNKGMMTSIDYRLNEWGNYVLLFLVERDGRLEPLSPQGVIPLEAVESPTGKIETGRDFLKAYRLINNGSENTELETLLQELPIRQLREKELLQDTSQEAETEKNQSILSRIIRFFTRIFKK